MKKVNFKKLGIASMMLMFVSLTSANAASEIIKVGVPRWGAWSDLSYTIMKTTSGSAWIEMISEPHSLAIYGQMYCTSQGKVGVATADDGYGHKYREVSAGNVTWLPYSGNYYVKDIAARISSSNIEPDYRYVTYQFNP